MCDNLKENKDTNGPIPHRLWYVTDSTGYKITQNYQGRIEAISKLEVFLLMFPPNHLIKIIALTNVRLGANEHEDIKKGELVKFFGIIILGSRYEFGSRRNLWATTSVPSFVDAPSFGARTLM